MRFDDLIGAPYAQGGRNPRRGIDCVGIVLEIHKRLGHELKDPFPYENGAQLSVEDIEEFSSHWADATGAYKAGDILLINMTGREGGLVDHCAVCIDGALAIQTTAKLGAVLVPIERLQKRIDRVMRYDG